MMNILEELYYGNVNPDTEYFDKQSQLGHAMKVLTSKEEELLSMLNNSEKEVFKKFQNAQATVTTLTEIRKFMSGFKLGAQIMLEAMKPFDEDTQLEDLN